MKVIPFTYECSDDLCSNTYIVIDSNKNCLIVDPSCNYEGLVRYITLNCLNPLGIILTHGHIDHIRGINNLYSEFNLTIYISTYDKPLLTDNYLNCADLMNEKVTLKFGKVIELFGGETLSILNEPMDVIATPYHTEGSLCFYFKISQLLFTGDSLFKKMIGRDDFKNSVPSLRKQSLNKIMDLSDEVKVYPGHGGLTSIGSERKSNPFIYR